MSNVDEGVFVHEGETQAVSAPAPDASVAATEVDPEYAAWKAQRDKDRQEAANAAAGYSQEDLDRAVAAALSRAGVNQNPGAELSPEELEPARQLTPAEQGIFNRTNEVPEAGDKPHLTSHVPV